MSRDTAQECRTAAQGTELGARGVTVKIPTAARSAGGTSRKRPKETLRFNAQNVDADEAAQAAGGVTTSTPTAGTAVEDTRKKCAAGRAVQLQPERLEGVQAQQSQFFRSQPWLPEFFSAGCSVHTLSAAERQQTEEASDQSVKYSSDRGWKASLNTQSKVSRIQQKGAQMAIEPLT